MSDTIIINTEEERHALIPDQWMVGTGLSSNSLYVTHLAVPLMIMQCVDEMPLDHSPAFCTLYLQGTVTPEKMTQLVTQGWELLKIYQARRCPSETHL